MLRLKDALASMEPDTMDGLKITTDSYSVLIRPSNTEPILRLYIETAGGDMAELEERLQEDHQPGHEEPDNLSHKMDQRKAIPVQLSLFFAKSNLFNAPHPIRNVQSSPELIYA